MRLNREVLFRAFVLNEWAVSPYWRGIKERTVLAANNPMSVDISEPLKVLEKPASNHTAIKIFPHVDFSIRLALVEV